MKIRKSGAAIPGVLFIEPAVFYDRRGYFLESYNREEFSEIGIGEEFVQDNHSCSEKGVVRGLHFQGRHPQGKLVRILHGSVYDVVVDIRRGSPHFGRAAGIRLSARDYRMLWIPVGFAHGFLALEDRTEVFYKTTEIYHPDDEGGILWNDPDLAIRWPLEECGIMSPIISEKDEKLPRFRDITSPFEFREGGP